MKNLNKIFRIQKSFNDLFFDASRLDQIKKEEVMKSLTLALHTEISSMISSINFKDHRSDRKQIDKNKILYEAADSFRYLVSILNLWGFEGDDLLKAFYDKDLYLNMNHNISREKWNQQPVLIVDLDDVIVEFRDGFITWIEDKYDISVDRDSTEYYTSACVKKAGLNPEQVFFEFIDERQLRNLSPISSVVEVINDLYDRGFWIHLLTARPRENLLCCYDTYRWIDEINLKFHKIDFSGEKYRWVAQSEYYNYGKIIYAIDDSAKHAAEYAKHNIKALSPRTSYNKELDGIENVIMYDDPKEILREIAKNV